MSKNEDSEKERGTPEETQETEARKAFIGEQVAGALKVSLDGCRMQVRQLWPNRYRVNVFAGKDLAFTKIAVSFFVHADGEGKILSASPGLSASKHYFMPSLQPDGAARPAF